MTRPLITTDPAVKVRRLRRAGARWRLLVHRVRPSRDGYLSDHAYDIRSHGRDPTGPYGSTTVVAGTEFDELVVGSWLHVEQMDVGVWWLNVGGVTLNIRADRDGRPQWVSVTGPYDDGVEGVTYECQWTDPDAIPDPPTKELSTR